MASDARRRYLRVTPGGCYHAVDADRPNDGSGTSREALLALLRAPRTPRLGGDGTWRPEAADGARGTVGTESGDAASLIEAGFAEPVERAETLPGGALGEHLPTLLPALSDSGQVVLGESRRGLCLDHAGIARPEAEELAALASAFLGMSDGRLGSLAARLGVHSRALAIVDPAGGSEIGFWPLQVGDDVFTLTVLGVPLLNTGAFRTLVWMLVERYDKTSAYPRR